MLAFSVLGFPGGSEVKNLPASTGDAGDMNLIPGLGGSPGGRSTPVFFPGKSYGQRSLAGYNPWSRKELNKTEHTCVHVLWKAISAPSGE